MNNNNSTIAAIKAVEWVHRKCGNLDKVLVSAKAWTTIDRSGAVDGYMLKAIGVFFSCYEEASPQVFAKRCVKHKHSPSTVIAQIKATSKLFSFKHASCVCLRDVYNLRGRPLAAPTWGND
jgi:hypothetical protein